MTADKQDPQQFTIGEVAKSLNLPQHVLRYWESKFPEIRPTMQDNRRLYVESDVQLISGIQKLLHERGLTIKGAKRMLQDRGVAYVSGLGQEQDPDEDAMGQEVISTEFPSSTRVEEPEDAIPPEENEYSEQSASEADLVLPSTRLDPPSLFDEAVESEQQFSKLADTRHTHIKGFGQEFKITWTSPVSMRKESRKKLKELCVRLEQVHGDRF